MEKTQDQKQAWLDGYQAALETAQSVQLRVDVSIDPAIELGAKAVAGALKATYEKMIREEANGKT